jgi:putative photosynthetic complex assembly protein 2
LVEASAVLQHVLPVLFAVFVWWFGTALVFILDQLPRRSFRWTMGGATLVLGAALLGVVSLAQEQSAAAAYLGFACGVLVWAWAEIGLLTGLITGPSCEPCPPGAEGMTRFRAALATILHHEIAILALAVVLIGLLWGAPNQVALHTFLVLWVMRQSAKLNIYLGARNLGEAMLPLHLQHLASYFRQRSMNALFPVSITGGTVAVILLVQQGMGGDAFDVTASTLLAALMALAVIEHWFLMLPLPLDGLWTWGRPSASPANPAACPQRAESARRPLRP